MDPNELLQQLMQLLQPSEAEAASRSQPNTPVDAFAKIQAQQAAQLQREQAMAQLRAAIAATAQQAKQASPQAQAQLAVTQAKAQPKPDLASLLGMSGGDNSIEAPSFPGDTFGGGPGAPISFGTNPRTGEQAFNNFGWVNQPTSGSGRAFDVAQQYASPEAQAMVEAARPGATGNADANKAKIVDLVDKLKKANVPIPKQLSDMLGEALTGVSIKASAPLGANASKYINLETGNRASPDMTVGEVTKKGTKFASLDAPQGKLFESLNNIKTHTDLIEGFLHRFPKSGPRAYNNLAMATAAQFGDPEAEAIRDMLSPITSLALSRALIGSGGRAGPALAAQLHNALPAGGDTFAQAELKIKKARELAVNLAKLNGLPYERFQAASSPVPNEVSGSEADWQTAPGGIRYRIK